MQTSFLDSPRVPTPFQTINEKHHALGEFSPKLNPVTNRLTNVLLLLFCLLVFCPFFRTCSFRIQFGTNYKITIIYFNPADKYDVSNEQKGPLTLSLLSRFQKDKLMALL